MIQRVGTWTGACVGACLALAGCGGGAPLLYPARTLATGDVRATGGLSGSFVVGSLASEISAAHAEASRVPTAPPVNDPTYAKGAVALAAIAPGVAPYLSARVGIGERFEGGVTYTGHSAHLDVRRSFDWDTVSLSVGLGVETPIYGDSDTVVLPQVDLSSVNGYGADLPIIVGWESSARAYMVWGGVRGGWDHTNVSAVSTVEGPGSLSLSCDRFYAGGVVGLAAGFRHVHLALELDVAYQSAHGTFDGTPVTVAGLSMAPSTAVWWNF